MIARFHALAVMALWTALWFLVPFVAYYRAAF